MNTSKVTADASRADSLVARIWPPAGLALGAVATVAWSGFLVYGALALAGLTH